MKKLLLVLLVITLASFLFVGCIPVTPAEGEGEGEGEAESVCPAVSVATEVEIGGKKYIKGGTRVITVTFAEATEPVSVYVGPTIKTNPVGVPELAVEVVMSPDADKKVWTGKYKFGGETDDCSEGYIYVATCVTCAPCKVAYTVDEVGPCSEIKIYEYPSTGCSCGGVNVRFVTPTIVDCDVDTVCGDACSGLDTYAIEVYKADPFGSCCSVPCLSPVATCSGSGCDIDCTLSCFDELLYHSTPGQAFYIIATLTDKVGNSSKYYATMKFDTDDIVEIVEYEAVGLCTDWSSVVATATGGAAPALTTLTIGSPAGAYGVCP